jgi:phosphoglucosamine mutase
MARELFGTDGVRGLAGQYPLDSDGAYRIGKAVGTHFAKVGEQIVIGWDTRESSEIIVADMIRGLSDAGAHTVKAGVIPTPGLSYVTREKSEFMAGIMITASHNPYQYNGVKVFDANGDKLPDQLEAELNTLIESELPNRGDGSQSTSDELITLYEDFLVGTAEGLQLNGLKVAVDSANGAASGLAERVFKRLGAEVSALFNKPDGRNINDGCGATDISALRETVLSKQLELGVALDGDADRLIMVDSRGREVKGDYLLYLLAVVRQADGVVATVMSNVGFEQALQKRGIGLLRTDVGDRYVLEGLKQTGYKLGGEQSGHIIFPLVLATGDGMLAAVQTLRAVGTSGKTLADWCDEVELLPQALVNIQVDDKQKLEDKNVGQYISSQQDKITKTGGRLLIRPSGTEPLVRVMVEANDAETLANEIANHLKELLQ